MSELSLNVAPSPELLKPAAGASPPAGQGKIPAVAGEAAGVPNPFATLLSGVLQGAQVGELLYDGLTDFDFSGDGDPELKGEVAEIKEIMKRSRELGMQTFDQSLFDLYEGNQVTLEDALRNADSLNDLRLQIKLHSQRARSSDLAAGTEHLTIV